MARHNKKPPYISTVSETYQRSYTTVPKPVSESDIEKWEVEITKDQPKKMIWIPSQT
jgi:hypothetical protein|tara:strand:- start:163 stop:333 length:171 start_codon:yes stop_codon:yes gene_type:complete